MNFYQFTESKTTSVYQKLLQSGFDLESETTYHQNIAALIARCNQITGDGFEYNFEDEKIFAEFRANCDLIARLIKEQRLENHRIHTRSKKISINDFNEAMTSLVSVFSQHVDHETLIKVMGEIKTITSTLETKAE